VLKHLKFSMLRAANQPTIFSPKTAQQKKVKEKDL
jgi:hypothetical protein